MNRVSPSIFLVIQVILAANVSFAIKGNYISSGSIDLLSRSYCTFNNQKIDVCYISNNIKNGLRRMEMLIAWLVISIRTVIHYPVMRRLQIWTNVKVLSG